MAMIEIDLEVIKQEDLTPNEYVYLWLINKYFGSEKEFNEFSSDAWNVDKERLQEKGYIKITDTGVMLRQKLINLMGGDFERSFAQLLSSYPMKVGTLGNYRVLRANDPTAKANDVARARYRKILHNKPQLHEKIMKLLDVQLKAQRDKLQYLPAFEVWLNARTWEKWEGMEASDGSSETRITNVL
jgi:hypothetical protein